MASYYFDTSAIVKLFVTETGSTWCRSVVDSRSDVGEPIHVVAFSEIGIVEFAAAVARREREGNLSDRLANALLQRFITACEERYFTIAVRGDVIRAAARLSRAQSLRAYDAVHLGTALVLDGSLSGAGLSRPTFVAADRDLVAAARREGLPTQDLAGPTD